MADFPVGDPNLGDYGDAPETDGYPSQNVSDGPRHFRTSIEWLGPPASVTTTETDSVQSNLDSDDASTYITDIAGQIVVITQISSNGSDMATTRYLNILVDLDDDGSWDGSADEWPLQNYAFTMEDLLPTGFFTGWLVLRIDSSHQAAAYLNRWARVTLSTQALPNGSGVWGMLARGETEDHLLAPAPITKPTVHQNRTVQFVPAKALIRHGRLHAVDQVGAPDAHLVFRVPADAEAPCEFRIRCKRVSDDPTSNPYNGTLDAGAAAGAIQPLNKPLPLGYAWSAWSAWRQFNCPGPVGGPMRIPIDGTFSVPGAGDSDFRFHVQLRYDPDDEAVLFDNGANGEDTMTEGSMTTWGNGDHFAHIRGDDDTLTIFTVDKTPRLLSQASAHARANPLVIDGTTARSDVASLHSEEENQQAAWLLGPGENAALGLTTRPELADYAARIFHQGDSATDARDGFTLPDGTPAGNGWIWDFFGLEEGCQTFGTATIGGGRLRLSADGTPGAFQCSLDDELRTGWTLKSYISLDPDATCTLSIGNLADDVGQTCGYAGNAINFCFDPTSGEVRISLGDNAPQTTIDLGDSLDWNQGYNFEIRYRNVTGGTELRTSFDGQHLDETVISGFSPWVNLEVGLRADGGLAEFRSMSIYTLGWDNIDGTYYDYENFKDGHPTTLLAGNSYRLPEAVKLGPGGEWVTVILPEFWSNPHIIRHDLPNGSLYDLVFPQGDGESLAQDTVLPQDPYPVDLSQGASMKWIQNSGSSGTPTSLGEAIASLNTAVQTGTINEAAISQLSLHDPEAPSTTGIPGLSDYIPFPWNTPADDNYIAAVAQYLIFIKRTGTHTISVRTDDGFAARFVGTPWKAVSGSGSIDPLDQETIYYAGSTGDSNTRGILALKAGLHLLEFIYFENTGGSSCQVAMAEGDYLAGNDYNIGANWMAIGQEPRAVPTVAQPIILSSDGVTTHVFSPLNEAHNILSVDQLVYLYNLHMNGESTEGYDVVSGITRTFGGGDHSSHYGVLPGQSPYETKDYYGAVHEGELNISSDDETHRFTVYTDDQAHLKIEGTVITPVSGIGTQIGTDGYHLESIGSAIIDVNFPTAGTYDAYLWGVDFTGYGSWGITTSPSPDVKYAPGSITPNNLNEDGTYGGDTIRGPFISSDMLLDPEATFDLQSGTVDISVKGDPSQQVETFFSPDLDTWLSIDISMTDESGNLTITVEGLGGKSSGFLWPLASD